MRPRIERGLSLLLCCAAVAWVACYSASYRSASGYPPPAGTRWAPPSDPPEPRATREEIAGTWTGTYTCPQGELGLKLTIQIREVEMFAERPHPYREPLPILVDAEFAFYPLCEGRAISPGMFTMSGSFVHRTGTLDPSGWKEQPADGQLVGLVGEISRDGGISSGTAKGSNCARFSMHKTRSP
jgi:hypothetical protein